ncbi:hypothetical protein JI435_157860 [Parastagonospora nodorum SN15]|uniref:Uncharacterized protein n=1 Tax=Phaeosphaeria nodorum (strain SN15 / ATCC MYA-4574 / FGSC 10173) TaxID=321614 RepID=A0A7U2F9E9_PHANO|nr:hypothetical protein JI435_157860 [Parastagonospora nodorum SN15]
MLCRRAYRLGPHSGLTGKALSAQCRSVYTHVCIATGEDLSPIRDKVHHTVRSGKDESAKDLPLPPLLDPIVLDKRSRWENTKAQPKAAEFTPFQKRLQANPYAHALASPVRQCRATLISLPVAFLTSLHARPHPTTNEPWLLPVSLTTDKEHLGPPYRFLGSHWMTTHLGKKKQWQRGTYSRMTEKLGSDNMKKLVWREDLPDLILDLMQKQLIKKLSWNFGFRGRLAPVASPRTEDIESIDHVSCVLIFRSLRTRADDAQDLAEDTYDEMDKWSSYFAKSYVDKLDPHAPPKVTHTPPSWYGDPLVPRLQPRIRFPELEFHTTTWRGAKVAVYSLADLLGEDKTLQLIEGSQYTGAGCVVVKQARHNVPITILLMRLQAYIARPGP